MRDFRRIGVGMITSIAVLLVLDLLPSPIPDGFVMYRLFDYLYILPGVGGMITMFVAAFGGAYVSKTRFIVPAVNYGSTATHGRGFNRSTQRLNQVSQPVERR